MEATTTLSPVIVKPSPVMDLQTVVDQFLALLAERELAWVEKERERYAHAQPQTFEAEINTKYIRIVKTTHGQRSVFCFLDRDGNILKAAGWKAPAKGVRGNIFNPLGALKGTDRYGADYLRG